MENEEASLEAFIELRSRSAAVVAVESLIYGLIATLALLGNLLVLGTVFRSSRLRNKASSWLITSLAVSDVAMAVLCTPPTLAAFISGRWLSGFAICQAQGFLVVWLSCASLETMALMAVDRYVRVLHPTKHRTLFAPKRMKLFIVAVWLWASTAPMPYTAAGNIYTFHPGKMFCFHVFSASTCVIYVHVAASLVVLTCCYVQVWRALRANAIRLLDVRQLPARRARITKEDVLLTRTLFVTVLGFLVCWTPVLVIDFVVMAIGQWSLRRWSLVMYCDLGTLSSCLNPIIYGAMNKTFRSHYKKLFAKKSNSRNEPEENSPASSNKPGRNRTALSELQVLTITEIP